MPLGEADTRAKLIDPALHARGWTEDLIRREETAGAIEVVDGRPRRHARGRVDYTLRVKVNATSQPVAVALIEAKAEHLPPTHGLEQGKLYAACKRLNVPLVFASNGRDLKAVNPNAKRDTDARTPEELLDLVEAKGREVPEAIARLRACQEMAGARATTDAPLPPAKGRRPSMGGEGGWGVEGGLD